MEIRLDGRVALVTGASSGIGYAAARALGEAGAAVCLQGHTHMAEAPHETAELVLNFASSVEARTPSS